MQAPQIPISLNSIGDLQLLHQVYSSSLLKFRLAKTGRQSGGGGGKERESDKEREKYVTSQMSCHFLQTMEKVVCFLSQKEKRCQALCRPPIRSGLPPSLRDVRVSETPAGPRHNAADASYRISADCIKKSREA